MTIAKPTGPSVNPTEPVGFFKYMRTHTPGGPLQAYACVGERALRVFPLDPDGLAVHGVVGPVDSTGMTPVDNPPAWLRATAVFTRSMRPAEGLVRGHVYAGARTNTALYVYLGGGQLSLSRVGRELVDAPHVFAEVGRAWVTEVSMNVGLCTGMLADGQHFITMRGPWTDALTLGRLLPEDWFTAHPVLIGRRRLVNLGTPMTAEQVQAIKRLLS